MQAAFLRDTRWFEGSARLDEGGGGGDRGTPSRSIVSHRGYYYREMEEKVLLVLSFLFSFFFYLGSFGERKDSHDDSLRIFLKYLIKINRLTTNWANSNKYKICSSNSVPTNLIEKKKKKKKENEEIIDASLESINNPLLFAFTFVDDRSIRPSINDQRRGSHVE